jgi:hypothetical protein
MFFFLRSACSCPLYSGCGQLLAWLSMERGGYESDRNRLAVVSRRMVPAATAGPVAEADTEVVAAVAAAAPLDSSPIIEFPIAPEVDQSVSAFVFSHTPLPFNGPCTIFLTTARSARHMIFHMTVDRCLLLVFFMFLMRYLVNLRCVTSLLSTSCVCLS